MKRAAILLGGVIAVGGGLFFVLHGDSKAETKTTNERAVDGASSTTRNAPTAIPTLASADPAVKPAGVEHANIDGLPDQLEPGYLAVEHAAKSCYRGHTPPKPVRPNGPDETIESLQLSYRQVVSHGVGHIEDLKVIDDQLNDESLQSCIVGAAASAKWASNAPDGVIGDLQQNVVVGDLMRPDYGLPPESRRSPKPTAPPPPELAGPLGKQADEPEDDHAGVVVSDPALARQKK